jgi:hypothetical protein
MKTMQTLIKDEMPFVKVLTKADPELLWLSVAIVIAEYYRQRLEPGSEKWQNDTRIWRPKLVSDIFSEWSNHSKAHDLFPWHDDYVLQVWTAFRKLNREEKIKHWNYFDISIPQ